MKNHKIEFYWYFVLKISLVTSRNFSKMDPFKLLQMQQDKIGTNCTFEVENDDGSVVQIHGHKVILSAASPVFEASLKSEWNDDEPIKITGVPGQLFKTLIHCIYTNSVSFKTLDEACEMYEAAHLYQVDEILDILRDTITAFCLKQPSKKISKVINVALKFQDMKLIHFSGKYFIHNVRAVLSDPDFMQCTPEAVNFFYQFDDFPNIYGISEFEKCFIDTLQKYVTANPSVQKRTLKPAIGSLRFLAMKRDLWKSVTFLTEDEKNSLMGISSSHYRYLSKKTTGRSSKLEKFSNFT